MSFCGIPDWFGWERDLKVSFQAGSKECWFNPIPSMESQQSLSWNWPWRSSVQPFCIQSILQGAQPGGIGMTPEREFPIKKPHQHQTPPVRGEIVAKTKFWWRGWVKTDFYFYFFQIFALETLPSLQMGALLKAPAMRQSGKFYWGMKWMNFDFEAVGGKEKELLSDTCSSNPLHMPWLCLNHPHLQFSSRG